MLARRFTLFLPVIIIFTLGAALPSPSQYAYQAKLSESKHALQRVELSLEVLLAVTRADLGDVAVFDTNGIPLPAWIRRAVTPQSEKKFSLPIYLFNTYLQSGSKTLTISEQNQDRLSESTTTETIPIDQTRPDYVISMPDAESELKIESIELVWTHEPADQLLQLIIEAGNDLDDWHTIQPNKSLTNQNSDDARWRTIDAIPKGEKYLRLRPVNSIQSFELKQAIGTYVQEANERKTWHRLGEMKRTANRQGYFEFDMPSPVQAHELKFIPGEQQSLLNGDLFASNTDFDQKVLITSNIQQHNFSGGDIEPGRSIKLPTHYYSHWWFKPNRELISIPQVEIALPVYELLFLGNDNGPYTLSWGNHESGRPNNDLIDILSADQRNQAAGEPVQMGSTQIAGGESRLSPQVNLPWLKWILWSLLVIAVITTGKMAINLYRDMKAS